jgi:hypothetical protein
MATPVFLASEEANANDFSALALTGKGYKRRAKQL